MNVDENSSFLGRKMNTMVKIFRVSVNHFMVDNSFVTASGMVYITLTALIPALTVFVTFFGPWESLNLSRRC